MADLKANENFLPVINFMTNDEKQEWIDRLKELGYDTTQQEDTLRAMLAKNDLEFCPFCGGTPISSGETHEHTRGKKTVRNYVAKIICPKCYVSMVVCQSEADKEKARAEVKANWNRRFPIVR